MKLLSTNTARIGFITCASTFVLGYLNGHTQATINNFVSPQTGNLVHLGLNLANRDSALVLTGFLMFFAFVIGSAAAQNILKREMTPTRQFMLGWTIFAVPIPIYLFFHEHFSANMIIFTLSAVSGVAMSFFRRIGEVELNNCIVTGNMRFFGINFHEAFFGGDKKRIRPMWIFFLAIFLFFFGAYVCGLALRVGEGMAAWVLISTALVPYIVGAGLADGSTG